MSRSRTTEENTMGEHLPTTGDVLYLLPVKGKSSPILLMGEHLPKSGVIFGLKFSEFVSSYRQML